MKTVWSRAFFACFLLLGAASGAQETALVDRIVAVVDDDAVLESELDRVIGLGLVERLDDEAERTFRRRVLDQVIEERLRFHEIDRFGFSELSLSEVDVAFAEVRSRFPTEVDFVENLERLGMTLDELKQLVARQLMVLTYVDERLGPRIFVSGEEIESYYSGTLVPELRSQGEGIPGLADVREQIREVVKQRRLDEEIASWTEELRQEADIDDFFDEVEPTLPQVVLGSDER